MKRALITLVAVVAPLAWFAATHVPKVAACSGYGPEVTLLDAPVIVEGWVREITELPDDGHANHIPHRVVLEVAQAHRGASAGDRLETVVYFGKPGIPVMCTLGREEIEGRYLVAGLGPEPDGPPLTLSYWATPYRGEGPEGPQYQWASRLAALVTDSDPSLPQITLDPPAPMCGERFHINGVRFEQGTYLLRFSYHPRILSVAEVTSGTFRVDARFAVSDCSVASRNGTLVGLQVVPANGEGYEWLVETTGVTIAGAVDNEESWPMLEATPSSTRCGEMVTVTGKGFLPGESLSVELGKGSEPRLLSTDADGHFIAEFTVPDVCANGTPSGIAIIVRQPQFRHFGDYILALETLWFEGGPPNVAVGPPDLGSGLRGKSERGGWHAMTALAAATMAGAAGFGLYTWWLGRRRA